MNRVQQTWFRQSRTEYTAAALVSEMTHWMISLGLSPDLLVRAARVVSDEVRHAAICHELYLHVGGDSQPVALSPAQLQHADDADAAMALRTVTAAGQLACEESIALAVFRLRVANATDPMAKEVCEVILRDEATHRAFAWEVLDALTALLGQPTVATWVRPRLATWLRSYLGAGLREHEPVYLADQLAFGLIDRRQHWHAMRAAVQEDVLPRMVERGLLEAGVGLEQLEAELA